jgi:hypothetical protein
MSDTDGMEPDPAWDRELGPFASLYEEWTLAYPEPRDKNVEARLATMYRDAWRSDDWLEQRYVLHFVYDTKLVAATDLILSGLASESARVANEAATYATVLHRHHHWDLGPTFRTLYRALVRRFPENDTLRPREFYGHRAGDVDDWTLRPFLNQYEDWKADEWPHDPTVQARLVAQCRSTWEAGDGVDRAFVLQFLSGISRSGRGDLVAHTDLVLEGLATTDPSSARPPRS